MGTWLLVPAGLATLAGFLAWERRYARAGEPVVDPSLFTIRPYLLACLIVVSLGRHWVAAYQRALLVTVALVAAALVATLVDIRLTRRRS